MDVNIKCAGGDQFFREIKRESIKGESLSVGAWRESYGEEM